MKADPAVGRQAQPIEYFDDGTNRDVEPCLLAHLAHYGGIERFAELHSPARQTPLALQRFLSAPDEQYGLAVHHHGANADNGVRRELAGHQIVVRATTRRPR